MSCLEYKKKHLTVGSAVCCLITPTVYGCLYGSLFALFLFYWRYEDDPSVAVPVKNIRPRARHKIHLDDVQVGSRVMVNYNYDEPETRGYWYDAVVTGKRNTRTIKELNCTVFVG